MNTRVCEGMLHFAVWGNEIVTANDDGSIPLNAKCGPPVVTACVSQANMASALLEACEQAEHWLSQPDRSIEPVAMLAVLREAITKAKAV